jgi:hypothetical protein
MDAQKDCALDQVEFEMLIHEFSDEALEIQAAVSMGGLFWR